MQVSWGETPDTRTVPREGPGVNLGDVEWGPAALACVEDVLQGRFDGAFAIYRMSVDPKRKVLHLSIDKLTDPFGAPSLDDLTDISIAVAAAFSFRG